MTEDSSRLFFQIAAGLIPVFVFGGVLTEKLRPSPSTGPGTAGLVVVLFLLFPVIAEVVAIKVAIEGHPSSAETWIVVAAVVFATFVIASALVWPWLLILFGRRTFMVVLISLVPIAFLATVFLESAVHVSGAEACTEEVRQARDRWLEAQQSREALQRQKGVSKSEADLADERMRHAFDRLVAAQQDCFGSSSGLG